MVHPLHHDALLFFFFFTLLIFSFPNDSQSLTITDNEERDILLSLKQHWGNPSSLHHWNSTSTSSPCHWPYISCIAGSVTEISLPGMNLKGSFPSKIICQLNNLISINLRTNNLSGTIPVGLSTCSNLETLDLSINHLTGAIPGELFSMKTLRSLHLGENSFSGSIPYDLGNLHNLGYLDLSWNFFSGSIPDDIGNLHNLGYLDLSRNSFSGSIPDDIGNLHNLGYLDLSRNSFSGSIPDDIGNLYNLGHLDLSSNSLSGPIPARLLRLHQLSYLSLASNNLSGEIPAKLDLFGLSELDVSHNHLSGTIPSGFGELQNLKRIDVSDNQFSGDIRETVSHMCAKQMIKLRFCLNNFSGRIPYEIENRDQYVYNTCFDKANLCSDVMDEGSPTFYSHSCSDYTIPGYKRCRSKPNRSKKIIITCGAIAGVLIGLVILILLFRSRGLERRKEKEKEGEEEWNMISFQRLDFREGESLGCLIDENLIGSGGSGKVYRVTTRQGQRVAVKSIRHGRKQQQCHGLEKQFLAEVKILGEIRHCNIVKLLCCITGNNTKLLVYEYMDKQCLYKLLHGKKKGLTSTQVLDWEKRIKIAIGAARGLRYMHHDCSPPVVHRDIKSSNILMDSEFNAKIADFGLAKMPASQGDPETASAIVGTFGYIAPEYGSTRKVSVQSDIYSFGVVLLELTTGREAVSANEDMNLAQWAHKHQSEGNSAIDALDEEIKDPRHIEAATTVFELGLVCTLSSPLSRPSMKYVLQILQRRSNTFERATSNKATEILMN